MTSTDAAARPLAIEPHYGSTVRDRQRYRRPEIEAEFDNVLLTGNGAKLFGLRRIGKSTEAAACAERLRAEGCTLVEIDAQGMTSEADLLMRLYAAMPDEGITARLLKTVTGDHTIAHAVREALRHHNRDKLDDIAAYFGTISSAIERALHEAPAQEQAGRLLLFVDELPWLCERILETDPARGKQRVEQLLAAMRKWRDAGMGMLLIGSIGLIALGRAHGLDMNHLNDLAVLKVPPFQDRAEATAFVDALAAFAPTPGWTPAHTQALLEESPAWYSSMLQGAFQTLTRGGKALALEQIPEVFAREIRPDLAMTFFKQFDRRMQRYTGGEDAWSRLAPGVCRLVLDAEQGISPEEVSAALATRAGEAAPPDPADLADALESLREDGFIDVRVERDYRQTWSAASPLVGAWHARRPMGRG